MKKTPIFLILIFLFFKTKSADIYNECIEKKDKHIEACYKKFLHEIEIDESETSILISYLFILGFENKLFLFLEKIKNNEMLPFGKTVDEFLKDLGCSQVLEREMSCNWYLLKNDKSLLRKKIDENKKITAAFKKMDEFIPIAMSSFVKENKKNIEPFHEDCMRIFYTYTYIFYIEKFKKDNISVIDGLLLPYNELNNLFMKDIE